MNKKSINLYALVLTCLIIYIGLRNSFLVSLLIKTVNPNFCRNETLAPGFFGDFRCVFKDEIVQIIVVSILGFLVYLVVKNILRKITK